MDSRVHPERIFGLGIGDAEVNQGHKFIPLQPTWMIEP